MDTLIPCSILFLSYIVYIVVSGYAYRYSKSKYTRIRREWRLLDGIVQDFDGVSRSANQITQKARQLMEYSELCQANVLLNDKKVWIIEARNVVTEATQCIQRFQELRKKRNSPKWFLSILIDMVPMVDVALGMRGIKKKIKNHLRMRRIGDNNDLMEEKICASDIYCSLEKSRSKVRSLLDRSILQEAEDRSFKCIPPRFDELISSLKNLIRVHQDLMHGMEEQVRLLMMHLELLQNFMKDLQSLKLESKLESSWVIEANETIDEAKEAIDTIHKKANRRRWITDFRKWMDRWKLREELLYVDIWITGLLEMKERYGFKFIRRDSSKYAYHRSHDQQQTFQYQTTDDTELSSAVNNIRNWLIQLPSTSNKLLDIVRPLSEELEDMHQLMKDTKATEYASHFRNSCLAKLKEMADNVECYSKITMEDSESKLPSAIIQIKGVVQLLHRCIKVYSIEVRADPCSVVGLEEDIQKLVLQLTDTENEHRSFISIVGIKGIGKTTLAKKVYHHDEISSHFKVRCWVSMPQESEEHALVKFTSTENHVLETKEKRIGKEHWLKEVLDFLQGKLYLLVLDNVSSVENWDNFKKALPEIKDESRVVVTTINKDVASHVAQNNSPHRLRLRTKEETWELFTQMVQYYPDKMEAHAKEVVGRSGGLPLAIIGVGKRLSGRKVKAKEFVKLLECISDSEYQAPWSDTMALNEKGFPLSKFFSYFQLFTRDFEIPVRKIVASWIAQRFVQRKGDDQTLEDIAYEYLLELIGLNMIQVVKRKPNGKVKTCCLPTTVHLLLQGQGNSSETRSRSSFPTTILEGQLSFHFDANEARSGQIHALNTNSPTVMRRTESSPHTILFFDTREGNKPGEEIGEFIRSEIASGSFRQLQVLDLERVFRPQLHKSIGKLKKLAYLGLRWTYLETIPESIGDLVNLQTLDLKHTYVRTLPGSIWKLKKLRHLYLNQSCQLPQPTRISLRNFQLPQPTGIFMRNLQILSGAFVDKGSPLKDGFSKLINLRKLGLAFQLEEPEQKVLATWIAKLTHLDSLRLRSINEKREPQPLKLEHFPDLQKLSSLYLFGVFQNPSIIDKLPQSLTHLTLSASGIKDDPMPKLGMLLKLKSLSLYSDSYTGAGMVCSSSSFPELLVLKLWKLGKLEKLDVQQGAMPKLKELEIRSCSNLTISIGLTHLKTLQEFKVS